MSNTTSNFSKFYLYYLREHSQPVTRSLHYIGTTLLWGLICFAVTTGAWFYLWLAPAVGYGFAWFGHFGVEKNKPSTFTHPFLSLASDHVMLFHFLTRRLSKKLKEAGCLK